MSGWKNKRANIYIIGPRASGKTTLAGAIAAKTGLRAVDTDALLEERQEKSIQDLVADQGWERFRDLEEEILAHTAAASSLVVATGGGVVLRPGNRELLKRPDHLTVYLLADVYLMLQRLEQDPKPGQRPPLSSRSLEEEIRSTLTEREPLYRECADLVLPAEHPSEVLAAEVISIYCQR